MLEINLNPFPILQTQRLNLRETKVEDKNEVFFLRSDPTVLKYIGKNPCQSIDEALKHIELLKTLCTTNEGISWAISLKENPAMIGNIGIWRLQKEHYRGEIGYVLHPAHHGKGIMNEAIAAVLDFGFNEMKLHSLEANVNPDNTSSSKLLEKNGFIREGYFKENYCFNGTFSDTAVYSLLDRDHLKKNKY